MGNFFKKLDKVFRKHGAKTYKIGFNAGDWYFSNWDNYIAFRKKPEDWKKYIDEYPAQLKTYIVDNFHLKLDPRFFKTYDIKKAPAMALAICDSGVPDIKSCKIRYLIRGNVSLEVFFDKISKYEKKYKDYVRYLQANKIVKNKKEVKKR